MSIRQHETSTSFPGGRRRSEHVWLRAASAACSVLLVTLSTADAQLQKLAPPRCTLVRPGFVSGTWTAAASPYCVTGDVTISPGQGSGSLTIQSGVEVRVVAGAEIRVTGTLVVQGEAGAPVLFTSADPSLPWAGLFFDGAESSSLTHANVRNANESGIRIQDSVVALEGCEISGNVSSSDHLDGGGIWASIESGDLVLRDCRVVGNTTASPGNGGGLWVLIESGDLVLEDCVISENLAFSASSAGLAGGNGGGIAAVLFDGRLVLKRCELERNRAIQAEATEGGGGAIQCTSAQEVVLTDCLIAQNECKGTSAVDGVPFTMQGGGMYVSTALKLTRCVVRDNRANANFWIPTAPGGFPEANGGGVFHTGASTGLLVENCVFSGNVTWATGENAVLRGAAIDAAGGTLFVRNTTIARNQHVHAHGSSTPAPHPGAGLHIPAGTLSVITSTIISRNTVAAAPGEPPSFPPQLLTGASVLQGPAAGAPISGSAAQFGFLTVRYSDVEGGFPGLGNVSVEPLFLGLGTSCGALELHPDSDCIDAGDPASGFNDVAFPPSQGMARNDQGANGGPAAAGWVNWERATLELVVAPRGTPCSETGVLALTKGGALTRPVDIFVEAIDGVPLPGGPMLLASGSFCSAGMWETSLSLSGACGSSSFTLRSHALNSLGHPVMSNAVNW